LGENIGGGGEGGKEKKAAAGGHSRRTRALVSQAFCKLDAYEARVFKKEWKNANVGDDPGRQAWRPLLRLVGRKGDFATAGSILLRKKSRRLGEKEEQKEVEGERNLRKVQRGMVNNKRATGGGHSDGMRSRGSKKKRTAYFLSAVCSQTDRGGGRERAKKKDQVYKDVDEGDRARDLFYGGSIQASHSLQHSTSIC